MSDLIVINQSQLKTWRACQQKWHYRYGEKLVPKKRDRAPHIGTWGHACLEAHYREGDWRLGHAQYLAQYDKLFDEERAMLDGKSGEPLPKQIERIMESYLWYNRDDGWTVVAVEQYFEVPVRVGQIRFILKGTIDLIIEDRDGNRWIVDHKWPTTIPDRGSMHAMDPQLILYPLGAKAALGIDTVGVIFNYVRARAPSVPTVNKDGSVSKRAISTDHPTVLGFLEANGLDPDAYRGLLEPLAAESPFLARYRLPRSDAVSNRVLRETGWTAAEIMGATHTTRNVTRDCARCSYMALCRAELLGLDTTVLRATSFDIEEEATEDGDTGDADPDEGEEHG